MSSRPLRAALYLRVSTTMLRKKGDDAIPERAQTTENQRDQLLAVAEHRKWQITKIYEDDGISGKKGREQRPGLDMALKDAGKGRYDVLMVWAVDRLGRSLKGLLETLESLQGSNTALLVHTSGVDTTTPAGKALFQMLGVFSEFEREIIRERTMAGIARRRTKNPQWGRRPLSAQDKGEILECLEQGMSIGATARLLKRGRGVVSSLQNMRKLDTQT